MSWFFNKKDEVVVEEADLLGEDDVSQERMTKEDRIRIYTEMGAIEGYTELLRTQMQADLLAYFNAPPEQKDMIKGALLRTRYTLNMVQRKGLIAPRA